VRFVAILLGKLEEQRVQPIFVMVKCKLGTAYAVAESISDELEEASEVYSTSGQFDLLVKFYLQENQDVGRFVTDSLQTLPDITDTQTIVTFKVFS